MSHFTTVKTKIKDLVALREALKDLNINFTDSTDEVGATVKGYQGDTQEARISIHISKSYDIGVKVDAQGNVSFAADWWGVETTRGWSEEEFLQKITRKYSYHKVLKEIEDRGYELESTETKEDETIQIRVRTY
jgi:hypothetical protein